MMQLKRLILVFFVVFSLSATADIGPAEFTQKFERLLLEADSSLDIEVLSPLNLAVNNESGAGHRVNLGNAYELYTQDPEALDQLLASYAASSLESMTERDALSIANIVPVVKDTNWQIEMKKALKDQGIDGEINYYKEALASGLEVFYAENTETSISYLSKETIVEANVELDMLRATAVENLKAALPDIRLHGKDGLYMFEADGNFEASLLLLDSAWDRANFDVDGDIVVSVPARDVVLVSGSNDAQLERLIELTAQSYKEATYFISPNLYVLKDGKWELFNQ